MATNERLEAFLTSQSSGAQEPPAAPATEPQTPPAPDPAPSEPTKPDTPAAPPKAPEEPEEETREARIGEPSVPRQALIDERAKRQDWKGKADRFEGENAELRKQLEALQKQPAPAPQPPAQPRQQFQWADPVQDPQTWMMQQVMHQKFENSELRLRDRLGDEVVDQTVAAFTELANREPMLWDRIKAERDPFGWAHREVQRQQLLQDVGTDPAAYEAKLRAKWEAERAAQVPQVTTPTNTPAPAMPPSLANARSAAPRSAPQWSGPISEAQLVAGIREQRLANRR